MTEEKKNGYEGWSAAIQELSSDRASRQVANKTEVDLSSLRTFYMNQTEPVFRECWNGAYVLKSDVEALLATPPATPGASTVLTDEQVEIVAEIIYKRMPADATGDPKQYPWVKRGNSHKQEDARSAAREVLKKLQVAAQAGQVAVPPGFAIVPRAINEDMHVAAVRAIHRATGNDDAPSAIWSAMIEVAPSPAKESK